jgi:predicted MFS family arabinose efflux permease
MASRTHEGLEHRTGAQTGWGAVFALTLCVATLIASEFMPISLLTPIAADLHLSEGRAGQAIAVSGIFAVLTSAGILVLAGVAAFATRPVRVRAALGSRAAPQS